jgi:hypothetical protein
VVEVMTPWYLALCVECGITQPFRDIRERSRWVEGHQRDRDLLTGLFHQIILVVEERTE